MDKNKIKQAIKSNIIFVATAFAFFTAGYLVIHAYYVSNQFIHGPRSELTIEKLVGGTEKFRVEIADSDEDMKKGLMYRRSMKEDEGMLFVFGDEGFRSFWMKNTYIPLDIIFINKNGEIHNIHPNAIPHDETPILSNGEVSYVLEINGGLSEKLGIEVGDIVKHPDIHE